MGKQYLIIGGVAAGASAAARLRRLDETADITILERGPYISYANCGLPYFVSGEIQKRSRLLLQTPEGFWSRYRVKVLTGTEARQIDRQQHQVLARGPEGELTLPYDKLILAQGGSPFIPEIPGKDLPHVFRLWTVPDMDRIHQWIKDSQATSALVLGAGFIGLEMAEAFRERGLAVQVVELAPQVLPVLDLDMANAAQAVLEAHGVAVHVGTSLKEIRPGTALLSDGTEVAADLVLLSPGVRPELGLARSCGLALGDKGGLLVDEYLQTSDPDILAAGDMVEIRHKVTGQAARIPLAGPANRQGRLAADNASGRRVAYHGGLGSSVIKLFDHTVASTGLGEDAAARAGLKAKAVTVHKPDHASYYPGATEVSLKLVFDPDTRRLLGAQAFGQAGVEKRVDVLAMALQGQLGLEDLAEVDLCYAPPYSSANDPVNMAAFVALNSLNGDSPAVSAREFLAGWQREQDMVLDLRTLGEWSKAHLEGARHIPLDELRERLDELPRDRRIWVFCESGYRAHLGLRILVQAGFRDTWNISGGIISLGRQGLDLVRGD